MSHWIDPAGSFDLTLNVLPHRRVFIEKNRPLIDRLRVIAHRVAGDQRRASGLVVLVVLEREDDVVGCRRLECQFSIEAGADFRAERARSLLDRRHRFVFSGVFSLPKFLGPLQLAPIWRVASGAPFNISIGGTDRNLDDVGNDRPNFQGDTSLLRWRAPGSAVESSVIDAFSLPLIGQSGNLPRNAGHGPGLFVLDLNVTREFRFNERIAVRPSIEFDNILNKTVFSFGSEFINFNALSPTATAEQRQAFLDSFLLATRTMRPRQVRVGLRVEF